MKKNLLALGVAVLTLGTTSAFEPQVHPGRAFCGIAPDGSIAVSYLYEVSHILDLKNGKEYEYDDYSTVTLGNGNFISSEGHVVGSFMQMASVWQNGEWKPFDSVMDVAMSYANGITRDGKRVVGTIAPDNYDGSYEGLMLVPCYWDLQSDGTYGDTNYLPYPAKDFAGRTPQYVTALSVSTDGKTIVGQVQDYSGFVTQPIVYNLGEDGEWTYTLVQDELYHPEGFVLPEDPGESPDIQPENFMTPEELAAYEAAVENYFDIAWNTPYPEVTDFMSDDSRDDYLAAMDEYYQTWENCPNEQDYMTEEEWEAYQQAVADYYDLVNSAVYPEYVDYMSPESWEAYQEAKKLNDEWDELWQEYAEAFARLCEMVPNFTFNNVLLTPDGKTYATTMSRGDFFTGYEYSPYLFDLENGTFKTFENSDMQLVVTSITDDGTILAQKPASWTDPIAMAYILPKDSETFEPLHSYLASKHEGAAAWITENLTHEFTFYDFDDNWEPIETKSTMIVTGIPFASADMSTIALGVENTWSDPEFDVEYAPAFGYILSSDAWAGVKTAQVGTVTIKPMAGAALAFTGDVASVTVYDLSGRIAFTANNPGTVVATGLNSGVYVVKAVAADNTVTIAKVAF